MPRKKIYPDAAARMRAYRERKKKAENRAKLEAKPYNSVVVRFANGHDLLDFFDKLRGSEFEQQALVSLAKERLSRIRRKLKGQARPTILEYYKPVDELEED